MIKKFITEIKENKRRRRQLIATIVIVIVGVYVLFSEYGMIKRVQLEMKKKELSAKIEQKKNISDSLKKEILKIKTDSTEIERIAREKYGMKKPHEKIYIIKEK